MIRRVFLKSIAFFFPALFTESKKTTTSNMIVSVARGDRGQVFDANGTRVENCVEANLTTGRCEVYELNENGSTFIWYNESNHTMEAKKIVVYHKVPMSFQLGISETSTLTTWESGC